MHLDTIKTDAGARSTKVLGPREKNELPSVVTNTHSLHTLKSGLARYILCT